MGNRAVISFGIAPDAPAVYVHWNGGRASVEGFLRAAKLLNLPPTAPVLQQVIKAFVPSADLIANKRANCDNGDNGQYIISHEFEIIGRNYIRPRIQAEEVWPEKTQSIAIDCIAAWHHWPT